MRCGADLSFNFCYLRRFVNMHISSMETVSLCNVFSLLRDKSTSCRVSYGDINMLIRLMYDSKIRRASLFSDIFFYVVKKRMKIN